MNARNTHTTDLLSRPLPLRLPRLRRLPLLLALVAGAGFAACERAPSGPANDGGAHGHAHDDDHGHAHDDDHAHDHGDDQHGDGHHHDGDGHRGEPVTLGEQEVGRFRVKGARYHGALTPGSEAAFDLWISPAADKASPVAAVRAWIGAEDARGALKARAHREGERWHVDVEVPSSAESTLRIEIEAEDRSTTLASFALSGSS